MGTALSVDIPHPQNLGLLRDKTCGCISLTNPLNDRKTAAKSWNFLILISSPVDRAPEPEDKSGPQGSAAFPKPQSTPCLGHIKHQAPAKTFFFKSPWHQVHHTPPDCNFGEIHKYNRNHYYFKIYPYSTIAGLGNIVSRSVLTSHQKSGLASPVHLFCVPSSNFN